MIEKVAMYALVDPKGRIIRETVRPTKADVWEIGFSHVAAEHSGFGGDYWKQWDASIAAAKKLGFVIKRVEVRVGLS